MEETQLTKEEAEAKASEIMAQILDDMQGLYQEFFNDNEGN